MGYYPQWLPVKIVPRNDGKTDKLPVDHRTLQVFPKGSDWQADPAATTTYENAAYLASILPGHGVGFLFTPLDPFFFIDIDYCFDGRTWNQLAQDVMLWFSGACMEISHSGKGLHIYGMYQSPGLEHGSTSKFIDVEFYTEKRIALVTGTGVTGNAGLDCTRTIEWLSANYFQPTGGDNSGDWWTTEPVEEYTGPQDDEELIKKALATKSAGSAFSVRASFFDLWTNNVEILAQVWPDPKPEKLYNYSKADGALAQHLAFWTGKNCERILQLMWKSGLAREKWNREDYLPRTIRGAVSLCTSVYSVGYKDGNGPEPDPEWPPLEGTKKQIEAASAIRAAKVAEYPDGKDKMMLITSAKFWLDNSRMNPIDIIAKITPVDNLTPRPTDTPVFTIGYQYLGIEQQLAHFAGCCYVLDSHKVFTPDGSMLKQDQFNAVFGGYLFEYHSGANCKPTKKAWEAFTENHLIRYPIAHSTCFQPSEEPGALVDRHGRKLVNAYVPVNMPATPGDPGPLLYHVSKLLPVQRDGEILISYMAACVQFKGKKFQWAPLIQGMEGNGKTLLTRCVAFCMGEKYVHMPPATEIGEKYNAWLFDTLLIGVEDIYIPEQKRELAEILKPMITATRYACRDMQKTQVMRDLVCNFMFNSNHKDAVRKTENDRHYCVFYTAQQTLNDLRRDGMDSDYFRWLYGWLEGGGYAIVHHFLQNYQIPDELNPAKGAVRPPETSSTRQAIIESLGGVEQQILEAIDEGRPGFAGGWVSSMALDNLLKMLRRESAIPINRRRGMLNDLGYDWHPHLNGGRVNNVVMPDNGKPRLFIKFGHLARNLKGASQIAKAYEQAQGVLKAEDVFGNHGKQEQNK